MRASKLRKPERGVRADAAALVWAPEPLDTLIETAELLDVSHAAAISMWLDYLEANPRARA